MVQHLGEAKLLSQYHFDSVFPRLREKFSFSSTFSVDTSPRITYKFLHATRE